MHRNNHKRYDPDAYAQRHGLQKREESRGLGSSIKRHLANKIQRYKERNTPARRQERIAGLKLKAQEEEYKSRIYRAKAVRGGSTLGKIIHGGTPQRSYQSRRGNRTRIISQQSQPHQYAGMNDLFGITGQQPAARRTTARQPRVWQGMDDLF